MTPKSLALTGMLCSWLLSSAGANEVGFLESFALASDREAALEQLVPGTRDYYFYRCLHLQNSGRLDEVDEVLKSWIKR